MKGIKIGDRVKVATCFGLGPIVEVTVLGLELVELSQKHGTPVEAVTAADLEAGRVMLDYHDGTYGRWARGSQVVAEEGATA